ncbi:MAG: phosphotransferase [Deltaproteobacteria bacterium]|nr:phosphotransferase [Deltaproteobacteria bacterium]
MQRSRQIRPLKIRSSHNLPKDIEISLKEVDVRLKEYFLRNGGQDLRNLEVLDVVERDLSNIVFLLAETCSETQRIVMKQVVHDPTNIAITKRENQAVVEYEILQRLYPKFQKVEGCAVPRPILVIPEFEIYLMDFVEGCLLTDKFRYARLFSSRDGFHQLRDQLCNCGRWLRHLQDFTGVSAGSHDVLSGVIERAEQRLRLIEESGDPRCPKDLRRKVSTFFKEQLEKLTSRKILLTGRHGDFNPWNIIVRAEGITVIDFLGYQEDCVPVDVLKMLVYLEDEMKAVTSSVTRVRGLKKSFLDSYGDLPRTPLPALLICEAMQRVVSLWGSISRPNRRLHHRIEDNRCIKTHVSWLMNAEKMKTLCPVTI